MSFRLPQTLGSSSVADRAFDGLNAEVLAEKAASLGRAGKTLAARLSLLREAEPDADRVALVQDAADAAYGYFVQRELCGLFTHQAIIEDYEIPREVLARMGTSRRQL